MESSFEEDEIIYIRCVDPMESDHSWHWMDSCRSLAINTYKRIDLQYTRRTNEEIWHWHCCRNAPTDVFYKDEKGQFGAEPQIKQQERPTYGVFCESCLKEEDEHQKFIRLSFQVQEERPPLNVLCVRCLKLEAEQIKQFRKKKIINKISRLNPLHKGPKTMAIVKRDNSLPIMTTSNLSVDVFEQKVGDLVALMQHAMVLQNAWQHYKTMKYSRRASENLSALTQVFEGVTKAATAAGQAASAQQNLMRSEVGRQRLKEIENLKLDLEAATLMALKAEQDEKRVKHETELNKMTTPPPPPPPKSKVKSEAEKQQEKEEEEDRRETIVAGWVKEFRVQKMSDEDIAYSVEKKKRARGWI